MLIALPSSIPLTSEVLTPRQACEAFTRGVGREVKYRRGPIEYNPDVSVPDKYRKHLSALQEVLGEQRAPYFGPDMYYPQEAIKLWEGNRGLEEYAHEIFPVEDAAHGFTWMDEDDGDEGTIEKDDSLFDGEGSVRSAEEVRAEAEQNYTGSC